MPFFANMMAVRAPLGLSPSNPLVSAFSPFSDNPDSPRPRSAAMAKPAMSTTERDTHLKAPPTTTVTSPQGGVAPSPVSSDVGTDFADVDEQIEEEDIPIPVKKDVAASDNQSETAENMRSPQLRVDTLGSQKLQVVSKPEYEGEPQSVIHVPSGFGSFEQNASPPERVSTAESSETIQPTKPDTERLRADSSDSVKSMSTIIPRAFQANRHGDQKHSHDPPIPPTPLQTALPTIQDWLTTPRAQTRQEFGAISRPGSSLASITEDVDFDLPSADDTGYDSDPSVRAAGFIRNAEAEIEALRSALTECWTLCNTLASLSYIHRERIFNFSGRGDMQEQAWKSCWKLCQNLYETRDSSGFNSARPTLDLCREFCQSLFEVRVRDNETADSVLRVSFELNNHLFNTHDRSLPEAFRERTLDFYITLCHRLMKQKSRMAEETDSLLRACWSLAEMLFSLRQNRREGRRPDEELLGSAIQACWELCDLFREGWTQIRPERGTPRPSQTTFTQAFNQARQSGFGVWDETANPKPLPETPTTIFEDTVTNVSPDEAPQPNIFVLPSKAAAPQSAKVDTAPRSEVPRDIHSAIPVARRFWSSTNSITSLSVVSDAPNSHSAKSADTVRTPAEDPILTLLKILFVKAAINTKRGYTRNSSDPNLNSLPKFAMTLPETAFGTQVWQVSLFEHYRKTVTQDPGFRSLGVAATVGERGRVNAVEVARAVRGMTSCVYGFGWLRDLYRYVFGFYVEEALKGEDEKPERKRENSAGVENGSRKERGAANESRRRAVSQG